MQSTLTTPGGPAVQVPVMVAAELQDSLLVVMHDLHRLEGLLNHATDNLLERFGEANAMLTDAVVADSPELVAARTALRLIARGRSGAVAVQISARCREYVLEHLRRQHARVGIVTRAVIADEQAHFSDIV